MVTPTAAELARALRRLPPRDAAWLRRRYLDKQSVEACAKAYGVSVQVVPIHTLRAARFLVAALRALDEVGEGRPLTPRDAPPLSDEEEAQLSARLEAGTEPILCPPLRALEAQAPEVRRLEQAWEAEAEASPQRRRQDWLRRGALVLLVALALWLYLRGN